MGEDEGVATAVQANSLNVDQIGGEIPGLFRLDCVVCHNTTQILGQQPLRVRTPAQPWAYSLAFEVQAAVSASIGFDDEIVVEVDLEVEDGEVYAGALSGDLQEFIGSEARIVAATGRVRARVVVPRTRPFSWLMIRNGTAGRESVVSVYSLRSYRSERQHSHLLDVPPPELANRLDEIFVPPLIVTQSPAADQSCALGVCPAENLSRAI